MMTIELRRQERGETRDSQSEIVADALWYYLERVEKVDRKQIEALVPEEPKPEKKSNLAKFPKGGKIKE